MTDKVGTAKLVLVGFVMRTFVIMEFDCTSTFDNANRSVTESQTGISARKSRKEIHYYVYFVKGVITENCYAIALLEYC